MQPAAVGQLCVDERPGSVQTSALCADDPANGIKDRLFVVEAHCGSLQPAVAFDPDLIRTVDDDVGDARLTQQGFQRTQTRDMICQLTNQRRHLGR